MRQIFNAGQLKKNLPFFIFGGTVTVLLSTSLVGFAPAVRARLGWAAVQTPAYAVGDPIDIPASLREHSERTLVVFASGTCGASVRSTPALKRLAEDLRGSSTRFLLVTPVAMKADQEALENNLGLTASEHATLDMSGLKVTSVPTMVLVDRSGRILFSREGFVDQAAYQSLVGLTQGKRS